MMVKQSSYVYPDHHLLFDERFVQFRQGGYQLCSTTFCLSCYVGV